MKTRTLLVLLGLLLLCIPCITKAQTSVSVNVLYQWTATTTATGPDVTTTGPIQASNTHSCGKGFKYYGLTNSTYPVANDPLKHSIVKGGAYYTKTNSWPAETAPNDSNWFQFKAYPKTNGILTIDSLNMYIGGWFGSTHRVSIYYSTDPTFTNKTLFLKDTALLGNQYKLMGSKISATVNSGDTLYIRIYPYSTVAYSAGSYKLIMLDSLQLYGTATQITPSSVLYQWNSTTTAPGPDITATGPIQAFAHHSYGKGFKYYGLTNAAYPVANDPLKPSIIRAGSYFTKGNAWVAETAPNDTNWFQFKTYPKTGGILNTDSLRMYIGGWFASTFRAGIYYSTDPTFATKTAIFKDTALLGNQFKLMRSKINAVVNSGDTLYIRIYPYSTVVAGSYKLIMIDSVQVFGKVTGVLFDPPTVTTNAVSYISSTFATCGGNIPSDGGATVTARGLVWKLGATPTITDNIINCGTGPGAFTGTLSNLTAASVYHVRAFATNSVGTTFGDDVLFTTLAAVTVPTVNRNLASNILAVKATAGGSITSWGGAAITNKGVCWSTTNQPSITDSKTDNGTDVTAFTSVLYPLAPLTKYYYRAYAINSAGVGYSVLDSVTTQAKAADVTKTVAKDGSGDYTTVQAAFNAIPDNYTGNYTINIKPGTYYEKLLLASTKSNVILKGIHPDSTILTFDDYAGKSDGAGGSLGTNMSYTVAIDGTDFNAMNITFQNTVKNTSSSGMQAVALRTNGDRQAYYNCKLLGYQDTYYAWGGGASLGNRIYMKNCYIEGTVDFIFGRDIVLFDSCQLNAIGNKGAITAPNTDPTSKFGFVFRNCQITAASADFNGTAITTIYLGRPWQASPRATYITCQEPAVLDPTAWTSMSSGLNPFFAEYKCTGDGFKPTQRSTNTDYPGVQLSDADAATYTMQNIFARTSNTLYAYDWMPNTTIYKFPQSISAPDFVATKKYGDAAFTITGTATSKLPVTITSSNTTILGVNCNTLSIGGAGNVNITFASAGNYLYNPASLVKTMVITKAALSATVDAATRSVGAANPAFPIRYTGFVNGDDESKITPPTATCTADLNSPAGTYPIVVTGGSSANYDIAVTNGVLTVTPATGVRLIMGKAMSIYPNPATDHITINRSSTALVNLELYNNTGSKVLDQQLSAQTQTINISTLPKGVYILKIDGVSCKLVIQ